VISSESPEPPKNTRDITVARYRYSVKSYHSTTVDRVATTSDLRGTADGVDGAGGAEPADAEIAFSFPTDT